MPHTKVEKNKWSDILNLINLIIYTNNYLKPIKKHVILRNCCKQKTTTMAGKQPLQVEVLEYYKFAKMRTLLTTQNLIAEVAWLIWAQSSSLAIQNICNFVKYQHAYLNLIVFDLVLTFDESLI